MQIKVRHYYYLWYAFASITSSLGLREMGIIIVITSCRDYCNTLLSGLPISIFALLKDILHTAARQSF